MNRPAFSRSQAADVTGASRSTIKRRHLAGDFPNAYKGTDGQWRIPIEDLIAAGYDVNRTVKDGSTTRTYGPAHDLGPKPEVDVTALINRLAGAESALAVEREKNIGLQNLNSEILKRADLAEKALLMIEAKKPEEPKPEPRMVVTDSPTPPFKVGHLNPADFPGMSQEQVDALEDMARKAGQEIKEATPPYTPGPKRKKRLGLW